MGDSGTTVQKGTCPVCGHACLIDVHLEDGRITTVERDRESVMGHLCERGVNAIDYHYHSQRLDYPLKRTGERGEARWERIPWDQDRRSRRMYGRCSKGFGCVWFYFHDH